MCDYKKRCGLVIILRVVQTQAILFLKSMSGKVRSTLNLNGVIFNRFRVDLEIQFQSRSMSDPTFSDIDFKNKMAWIWTTLKISKMKLFWLKHQIFK